MSQHQICTFHVIAEVGKAVLGAVASARKGLAAQQPKLPKGRPSQEADEIITVATARNA